MFYPIGASSERLYTLTVFEVATLISLSEEEIIYMRYNIPKVTSITYDYEMKDIIKRLSSQIY